MANQDINQLSWEDRIDGKLLDSSTHFLYGEIDEDNIAKAIKWIAYENLNKTKRVLTLYVNSHGGDLYQAFGLIDVMKSSALPIRTIAVGSIMSAAFLIFASGTRGHRIVARNTGIMCHQYSDQPEGKHHDLRAQMEEGNRCNQRMLTILQQATNLPVTKIKSKLLKESDVYMTAQDAVDYGIADAIL